MQRSVFLFSFIIFLMVIPLVLYASSPQEEFNSDLILAEAVSEIGKMGCGEIEVFISYLASCNGVRGGKVKEFYCDRATRVFLIKYERGRAIDLLDSAHKMTWMLMDLKDLRDKEGKRCPKKAKEFVKMLKRSSYIMRELENAANRRFRSFVRK